MTYIEVYQPTQERKPIPLSQEDSLSRTISSSNHEIRNINGEPTIIIFHPDTNELIGSSSQLLKEEINYSIVALLETPKESLVAKMVRPKQTVQSQIIIEKNILELIGDHPNIIKLKGLGMTIYEGKQCPVLLTHFISDAVSIKHYFEDPKPNELYSIVEQITQAIHHIHQQQIVHADINPWNILIQNTPAGPRAIIIDFSISAKIPKDETYIQTNHALGFEGFVPLEQQNERKYGYKNDVFGLAATLMYILTEDNEESMLYRTYYLKKEDIQLKAKYNSVVDHEKLKDVFIHALAKNPNDRTESILAFLEEFKSALH